VLLYRPGLSTGRSLIGTSGGQCGQLKHQYKAGDNRMEKRLLTVWEAADVLSISRSRVYELLYAEQLDSVKIGRSRRVLLASVRVLGGRSVGVMTSRRPQGEGPDGLPRLRVDRRTARPDHVHPAAPSSRRGTATLARSIRPRSKPRPLLWTVISARGNNPPTPATARGSASPDDQPKPGPQDRQSRCERSESAGHERSECP
jgi:excisionase family DNA binding protein